MPSFDPKMLALWTGGQWVGMLPKSVTKFHFDTRKLSAGDCFVALQGETRDGHDFIEDARQAGASCALVHTAQASIALPQLVVEDTKEALGDIAAAHRETLTFPIAAITGSFGKTSTKELLTIMLGDEFTGYSPGNWNNEIGVPLSMLQLDNKKHRYGVIEAGISEPGEMKVLGRTIKADFVVFSGIGPAHLEALGDEAGVAAEKFLLAEEARTEATLYLPEECLKFAVFHRKLDRSVVLVESEKLLSGLTEPKAVARYQTRKVGATVQEITVYPPHEADPLNFMIASPSVGMARNAALAALAAQGMGARYQEIVTGAARWRPEALRGSWRELPGQRFYVDCYNANPVALKDALEAFDAGLDEAQNRLLVLGTMLELGTEAASLHTQVMAAYPAQPEDHFIFVGDERLCAAYRKGALEAGVASDRILAVAGAAAIRSEVQAFKGAVFLKGSRSHKLESLVPQSSTYQTGTY